MAVSHDVSAGADGELVGDPTEVALLRAARVAGRDPAAELARLPRVDEVPFDSARKCMTTIHRLPDGGLLAVTKGAPEVVLAASVSVSRGAPRARTRVPSQAPLPERAVRRSTRRRCAHRGTDGRGRAACAGGRGAATGADGPDTQRPALDRARPGVRRAAGADGSAAAGGGGGDCGLPCGGHHAGDDHRGSPADGARHGVAARAGRARTAA